MPRDQEPVWFTVVEVAERFRQPVSTIRQRIQNVGTKRCPRYRIHQRELKRLEA
jgi:hypothetical protein